MVTSIEATHTGPAVQVLSGNQADAGKYHTQIKGKDTYEGELLKLKN